MNRICSPNDADQDKSPLLTPLTIAFAYFLAAAIYIVASDRILLWLVPEAARQAQFQTYKGWAYVVITALLLYFLITRAFEALQSSIQERSVAEARLRTIIDSERDAVFTADANGLITLCNTAARRLLDCGGECSGRPLESILAEESRPEFLAAVGRVMGDPGLEPPFFEVAVTYGDGPPVPAECTLAAGRHAGEVFLLCTLRDISARKEAAEEKDKLEQQLRVAQRMEALGTLASGIAHDFNNSLAVIIGYTELALMDLPDDSRIRDDLQQVLVAGQRAKELVLQVLTFSRQTEHELAPLSLTPLVKETAKLLRGMLPSTITVQEAIEPGETTISGDGTRLHQVLMNLCTNAYQAMSGGGSLTIGLDTVRLDTPTIEALPGLTPGPHVRLTVADTGCGMAPNVLEHVFDPFFTTKQDSGGTGLGLAVVHGIVKSHGGHITVYSEPGKGTTFHVYLPSIARETQDAAQAEQPLQTGTEHVLVIDDEQLLAAMTKKALESLGYSVTTMTSPETAIETLRARPDDFDLVITDQTMPGMTGEILAHTLKRIQPRLPVILVTGFADIDTRQRAAKAGIRAVLLKPATIRELAAKVRRALDEEQPEEPAIEVIGPR